MCTVACVWQVVFVQTVGDGFCASGPHTWARWHVLACWHEQWVHYTADWQDVHSGGTVSVLPGDEGVRSRLGWVFEWEGRSTVLSILSLSLHVCVFLWLLSACLSLSLCLCLSLSVSVCFSHCLYLLHCDSYLWDYAVIIIVFLVIVTFVIVTLLYSSVSLVILIL